MLRRMLAFLGRKPRVARPPLDQIADAEFPLIVAPWKGALVPIKVRRLSVTQIRACGNFTLIETPEYKAHKEQPTTWKKYCEYAETQTKLVRAALVSPTYEQIFEAVGKKGFNAEARQRFIEIKKEIDALSPGPYRKELEEKNEATRVLWEFLLPEDFIATIVNFELEPDNPVIKSMTNDLLVELAVLADRWHDRPSDHVDGTLTAFHRMDIDSRAAIALEEYREEHARKRGPKGPKR